MVSRGKKEQWYCTVNSRWCSEIHRNLLAWLQSMASGGRP